MRVQSSGSPGAERRAGGGPRVLPRASGSLLILALALLLGPRSAGAYVPYTSETTGEPLRWFSESVGYMVSEERPGGVTPDDFRITVQQAMRAWDFIEGCGIPHLVYLGTSDRDKGGFDQNGPNENLVAVIDDEKTWSDQGFPRDVLAMTTLTFEQDSGEIVDADIELNDWNFSYSTGNPVPPNRADLLNTVVHEVGHFLGLDHSPNPEATMYWKAPSGESKKRSLHEDDIDGVCFLYRYDPAEPVDAMGSTRGGASGRASGASACSAGRSVEPGAAAAAAALLLLLLGLRRRLRARPGRA